MDPKRTFRPTCVRALVGTAAAAVLGLTGATSLLVVAGAAGAATSASALLSKSEAALKTQATVTLHISSTSGSETATGSFSQGNGYLSETHKKSGKIETIAITLIGSMVYLRGNKTSLSSVFHFPTSIAQKYANHWLSFTSKTPTFKGYTSSFRVTTILSSILKSTHPLTVGKPTTFKGKRAIPIKGSTQTTTSSKYIPAILYVASSGTHLPLGAIQQSKGVTTETATFTVSATPKTFPVPTGSTSLISLIKSAAN